MGDEGWSADQRAADLRARGKRSAGAWAAGAEGERRVAAALATLPDDWLVLHDRLLMPGLTESNIDHLLVGPAGVVLVDAKNWAGHLSKHEGTVFQHSSTADGSRRHRPLNREFAVVHSMASEVARRVGVGVTAVIALAGRRAADFGEPRMVRDVWVVPVDQLTSWLAARPRVSIANRHQLEVTVRTEFPSTTTDAALLVAMGRELDPGFGVQPRRGARSVRRPSAAPRTTRHTPARGRRAPQRRSAGRQRGGRLSAALGLLACIGLIWAASNGVMGRLMAAAMTTMSRSVAPAYPTPTPPEHVSCVDVDLAAVKATRGLALTPRDGPMNCSWTMPTKDGRLLAAVTMIEMSGASERVSSMLERARAAGRAETIDTYGLSGKTVVVWAPAGTPLSTAKNAPVATRSMTVHVAYEVMGLTPREGGALARSIVALASRKHTPIATSASS